MKKIAAIIIILSLSISCTAFADESASITFRDIPWGISTTDFETTYMSDTLCISELSEDSYIEDYNCECQYVSDRSSAPFVVTSYFTKNGGDSICYRSKNVDYTVAGYPVSDIRLAFLYAIDINKIDHSKENATFYAGSYTFEQNPDGTGFLYLDDNGEVHNTQQNVYDDLFYKLSTLYGECDYNDQENSSSYWFDDDNNSIVLVNYSFAICLYYFQGNKIEYLEKLHDILANQSNLDQQQTTPEAYDGL